ncbi:MAG: DUF3106 domain-containing protein [Caldimonas sp.]
MNTAPPAPARRAAARPWLPALRRRAAGGSFAVLLGLALLAATAGPAQGQGPRPAGAPATGREDGTRWLALTPVQRDVLAPLEREWPNIDAARKQKWIVLANRYRTMPPGERARITERMTDWARLTPAERGQARLRYEETRQFPAPDRQERWRAYEALSPEERRQFASRAASAGAAGRTPGDASRIDPAARAGRAGRGVPAGKANLVPNPALARPPKQIAPTVIQASPGATTTPINRRPRPPAHQQTGMPKIATTPEFINRGTLLPRRGPQAAAVVSPAPATTRTAPVVQRAPGAAMPPSPQGASSPR